MITSLSILLPVHNAEGQLAEDVAKILDVLMELTTRFDLVIVDDGSTDDTVEVARDLATQYPQVNLVRHPVRLGLEEAIETGLNHAAGEVVLVRDANHGLDPRDVHLLWSGWHTLQADTLAQDPTGAIGSRIARLIGKPAALAAARRSRSAKGGVAVHVIRIPAAGRAATTAKCFRLDLASGIPGRRPPESGFLAKVRRVTFGG